MVLKVARFVNLFLVALLAGLLVGVFIVERALLEVSASVYTAVQKPKHEVFEPIMPIFNTLVIVSGLMVLQRVSQCLTHRTVSGMLEEAPSICGGDCRERRAYRFYQSLFAPGDGFAK